MAKSSPAYAPIDTLPGVMPDTDNTMATSKHYVWADKIRFKDGIPEKISGYRRLAFDYGEVIKGIVRSYFSTVINGKYYQLAGTAYRLYSVIGSRLTNITPLVTVPAAIPNSLDTTYYTLANNALSSTDGSLVIRVPVANEDAYTPGDIIHISGATAFNGVTALELNGSHAIRTIGIGYVDFFVSSPASATGNGGGNSIVFKSGLVVVNKNDHGLDSGDRVAIDNASAFGGINPIEINDEFIIRKTDEDYFFIMTGGEPTSSVTGGGGASIELFVQIPAGLVNEGNVLGYGSGFYGTGLYGVARESQFSRSFPRIWFSDRYGDTIITTPGNQTGLYQWFGDTTIGPALIANAPTAINYAFVSDNIIVTLGAGGIENRIFACDQDNITEWTSSSVNQVYDDDIEGSGRLLSHCPVEDYNLIFSEHQTYTFRYIGGPFVWEIKPLDETIGLIAPMARVPVKGMAFWMGLENFYFYRGGTVEVIPANTQSESTCLKYVFGDLNWGQKSKFFAWYNRDNNEVWFHYASAASNECDRVVVVNVLDFTWTLHTFDRTAAEYPSIILKNPHLASGSSIMLHEDGNDADGAPMPFVLQTNKRMYGKNNAKLMSVIPDSRQTQDIQFKAQGFLFPQSDRPIFSQTRTVKPNTQRVPMMGAGRFIQYTISGDQLNQEFMMGSWLEEVQRGPTE